MTYVKIAVLLIQLGSELASLGVNNAFFTKVRDDPVLGLGLQLNKLFRTNLTAVETKLLETPGGVFFEGL
jgi:hypothetical protein